MRETSSSYQIPAVFPCTRWLGFQYCLHLAHRACILLACLCYSGAGLVLQLAMLRWILNTPGTFLHLDMHGTSNPIWQLPSWIPTPIPTVEMRPTPIRTVEMRPLESTIGIIPGLWRFAFFPQHKLLNRSVRGGIEEFCLPTMVMVLSLGTITSFSAGDRHRHPHSFCFPGKRHPSQ